MGTAPSSQGGSSAPGRSPGRLSTRRSNSNSRRSAASPSRAGTSPSRVGRRSSASSMSTASGGADASANLDAPGSSDRPSTSAVWVYVKAKTRQHDSTKIVKKTAWFEAKNQPFTIGSSEMSDFRLDDDRCMALNARLYGSSAARRQMTADLGIEEALSALDQLPGEVPEFVTLKADARMYRLIGMGTKKASAKAPIKLGSVIKVGSASLEVTVLCNDLVDDFADRFRKEIKRSKSARVKSKRSVADGALADERDPVEMLKKLSVMDGGESDDDLVASQFDSEYDEEDGEDDGEESDEAICYICWGGPEETTIPEDAIKEARDEKKRIKAAAQGLLENAMADPSTVPPSARDAQKEARLEKKRAEPNPLINNPCGKCSGGSKYVHLQCILTWIRTHGSGHCSVCNGALPKHFASPPPNLELKVVRHRRGQSWVGTRRFRLSFADRDEVIIGRDSASDVCLMDRSVCGTHAKLSFDHDTRTFFVEDCSSLSGTYLQVVEDVDLQPSAPPAYFKIGRTILSVRVTRRRNSLIRSLIPNRLQSHLPSSSSAATGATAS